MNRTLAGVIGAVAAVLVILGLAGCCLVVFGLSAMANQPTISAPTPPVPTTTARAATPVPDPARSATPAPKATPATSGGFDWDRVPDGSAGQPDPAVTTRVDVDVDGSVIESELIGRFTPEAIASWRISLEALARQVQFRVPLRVRAVLIEGDDSFVGSAGPLDARRNFPGAPVADVYYPIGLASQLAGTRLNGRDDFDIEMDLVAVTTWRFHPDGRDGPDSTSFPATVVHELLHGMGILGTAWVDEDGEAQIGETWADPDGSTRGRPTLYPDIFDTFVYTGDGVAVATMRPGSAALYQALTGNDLWFRGPATVAETGRRGARLYAPAEWEDGSSYGHLDDLTWEEGPDALMTTAGYGAPSLTLGPVTRAILTDLGWTLR